MTSNITHPWNVGVPPRLRGSCDEKVKRKKTNWGLCVCKRRKGGSYSAVQTPNFGSGIFLYCSTMEGKPVQLKGVIAQEGGHDVGRAARDHDRSDSRNNFQVQWLCSIRRLLLPATRKNKPCGMLLRFLTQMLQQILEAYPTHL